MYEFPCDSAVSTDIRISAGRCDVTAEDRADVTVQVDPVDANDERSRQMATDTVVEFSGDKLLIRTPDTSGGGWSLGRRGTQVRVTVHLPTDSSLEVKVASADLNCVGRVSRLNINNASGNVYAEHVTGDVSATSASGDIRLGQVDGDIKVNAASGDLTVDSAGGDVINHSASGDTSLGSVHGVVDIRSASGDVRIGNARSGKIKAGTASGDVTIGVPAGTGVWLDLNTASGTTTSDLAVGAQTPLSGHDLELRVSTVSGDIEVHRVAASVV